MVSFGSQKLLKYDYRVTKQSITNTHNTFKNNLSKITENTKLHTYKFALSNMDNDISLLYYHNPHIDFLSSVSLHSSSSRKSKPTKEFRDNTHTRECKCGSLFLSGVTSGK